MREIKFRTWQGNRFHYWGFIKSTHSDTYEFHAIADTNAEPLSMTEKMNRSQQFTGLLDKNGKEIYEGDIINVWAGTVYFDDTVGCFRVSLKKRNYTEYLHLYEALSEYTLDVIGNIYENPGLLEVN